MLKSFTYTAKTEGKLSKEKKKNYFPGKSPEKKKDVTTIHK